MVISYEDFSKIDICSGLVVKAEVFQKVRTLWADSVLGMGFST